MGPCRTRRRGLSVSGKLPDWVRPRLTETQLNGEEKRLAARKLFPHNVRVDLIRALASMLPVTNRAAACRKLGEAINVSDILIDNVLNGRAPIYGTLLIGLYGEEPGNQLPAQFANPAGFNVFADHAAAAGLLLTTLNSGPGDSFPSVAPAPVAAASLPPSAAAELPAVPQTISPAIEPADQLAEPPATLSDTGSLRASDAASQGGEGDSAPAGGAGPMPVLPRETAGEGSRSDGAALPPSFIITGPPQRAETALDPALDELAKLAQRAARDVERFEAEMQIAQLAWKEALARRDAARQAYNLLDDLRRETAPAEKAA